MLNLESISEMFKKELEKFFLDEQVVDCIYTEQYGSEYYSDEKQKEKCRSEYKDIMDNTVFIPYINLDDFETFLMSKIPLELLSELAKKVNNKECDITDYFKGVDNYLNTNYKPEYDLLKKLRNKKKNILKQYTQILLEKISEIQPDIFDENMPKLSNLTSSDNADEIKNFLDNNKKLKSLAKRAKINKYIEAYIKCTDEKILMETSSYFKHRKDISSDKYGTPILQNMQRGNSFVEEKIGRDSAKNCRYIYIPVMKYMNKSELLEYAIHEVMHISKEKLTDKTNKSGLVEGEIPKDKRKTGTEVNKGLIKSIFSNLHWNIVTKKVLKAPKHKNKYVHTYKGTIELEEVLHQWQVRNVLKEIEDKKLDEKLKEPYELNGKKKFLMIYNKGDKITKLVMDAFLDSIQAINSGVKSVKQLKKEVGEANFNLLGKLYRLWDFDNSKINDEDSSLIEKLSRLFTFEWMKDKEPNLAIAKFGRVLVFENEIDNTNNLEYEQIGEEIVKRMKTKSQKMASKKKVTIDDSER